MDNPTDMTKEKNNIRKENGAAAESAKGQPETKRQDGAAREDAASRKDKPLKKEIEALKKEIAAKDNEIEASKAALAKEKEDYMRLMAEFETFRRRSADDRLNLVKSASADVIKGMLTTLDECERAMGILEKSSDEAAKEGTSLIYGKLMGYLQSKGLKPIDAKGNDFDTDFHEAVTQFPVEDESQKGKVIDVVQTGYTLDGKVIRYAKVVVGA